MILERKNFKVFGIDANVDEIGQFGSNASGTKLNTKDIDDIQGLAAWSRGWGAAVIGNKSYPALQERNAVDYAISYQQGYLQQEGIGEWHPATEYRKGSIVKSVIGDEVKIHRSIKDNNIGNPLSDSTSWVDWSLFAQQSLENRINELEKQINNSYPDYAKGISINSGYTTVANGFIAGYVFTDNGSWYIKFTYLNSENQTVSRELHLSRQSGDGECGTNFFYPVAKGTTITWRRTNTSSNNTISTIFIPTFGG